MTAIDYTHATTKKAGISRHEYEHFTSNPPMEPLLSYNADTDLRGQSQSQLFKMTMLEFSRSLWFQGLES